MYQRWQASITSSTLRLLARTMARQMEWQPDLPPLHVMRWLNLGISMRHSTSHKTPTIILPYQPYNCGCCAVWDIYPENIQWGREIIYDPSPGTVETS